MLLGSAHSASGWALVAPLLESSTRVHGLGPPICRKCGRLAGLRIGAVVVWAGPRGAASGEKIQQKELPQQGFELSTGHLYIRYLTTRADQTYRKTFNAESISTTNTDISKHFPFCQTFT